VDVLNRHGEWDEGIVVDVFEESKKVLKFVLMRFVQQREEDEWISIMEGRIVPWGTSTGKTSCFLAPSRTRPYRIDFNQHMTQHLALHFPERFTKRQKALRQRAQQFEAMALRRQKRDTKKKNSLHDTNANANAEREMEVQVEADKQKHHSIQQKNKTNKKQQQRKIKKT
jgi:hypothetical protein